MAASSRCPGNSRVSKAYRRFFLSVVGLFLLVVLVFAAVNTWVNPLWVTPAPWSNEGFADYRQIYRNLRTAKAGLARSKQWDVAFLGSSRIAIGLDPALPQWGDAKVVNLGLSGGSLNENAPFVEYLLKRQSQLRELIVGVDLVDLTTSGDMARYAGFYESPLNPNGDVYERELRYIAGVSSFAASCKTLSWKRHDRLAAYTPLGHWIRYRANGEVRNILYRDSIPHAIRMIRQRRASLVVFPEKKRSLERIIAAALTHGVKLTLLIPPNHSAYLSTFFVEKDADPVFSLDRRTIVEAAAAGNRQYPGAPPVTVWDFNDFHPLNSEPLPPQTAGNQKLHYWADGTHALESLGNVMLKRIMGWPIDQPTESDYGQKIDEATLPARLQFIRDGEVRYRQEHPTDYEWVQDSIRHYSSSGAATAAEPR